MQSPSHSRCPRRRADCPKADRCQREFCPRPNILYVVGVGPGNPDYLSKRSLSVLNRVKTIAGFTPCIDLIRPLLKGKHIVSTDVEKNGAIVMEAAVEIAFNEGSCAVVSAGDPEIYAMTALAFEMCRERQIPIVPAHAPKNPNGLPDNTLLIEVVPGIPDICCGAALLGAPLSHDFVSINLNDPTTPWKIIEQRIEATARADFVIVIANPTKKGRNTERLEQTRKILLKYRAQGTPVGIVSHIASTGQSVTIVPLAQLHTVEVDMPATVFVGNSATSTYMDCMITPRVVLEKTPP